MRKVCSEGGSTWIGKRCEINAACELRFTITQAPYNSEPHLPQSTEFKTGNITTNLKGPLRVSYILSSPHHIVASSQELRPFHRVPTSLRSMQL